MDNNFNISGWRRQQLHKEIIKEENIIIEGQINESKVEKIYDTIEKFLDPKYTDTLGKSAVIGAISRGLFLEENLNENDFNYGIYSKDEVIAKVGPGGKVRWFNKLVTVDELPDQVQFTKVISGIPTFINAGGYKTPGDSMSGFDPEEEKSYAEKRRINRNI